MARRGEASTRLCPLDVVVCGKASTLARLLEKYRGKRNLQRLLALTIKVVLAWANAYDCWTGCWLSADSGPISRHRRRDLAGSRCRAVVRLSRFPRYVALAKDTRCRAWYPDP